MGSSEPIAEKEHFRTLCAESGYRFRPKTETPDRVEDENDTHSRGKPLFKCGNKEAPYFVVLKDVHLEIDRLGCSSDRVEHAFCRARGGRIKSVLHGDVLLLSHIGTIRTQGNCTTSIFML